MNCRTVQKLTSAYLEEEVTAEERRAMDAHLPLCQECTAELHDTRRMLALVHGLPRLDASANFVDTVMLQVREAAGGELAAPRGWRRVLPAIAWPVVEWPGVEWPRLAWAPAAMAAGVLLTLGGIRVGLVPVASLQPDSRTVAVAPPPAIPAAPAPSAAPAEASSTLARAGEDERPRADRAAARTPVRPHETPSGPAFDVAARNPLVESQVGGLDAFELRGHDLLDPSYGTQVDLVLDRVALDGRVIQPAGVAVQPVQGRRSPVRRLRTF